MSSSPTCPTWLRAVTFDLTLATGVAGSRFALFSPLLQHAVYLLLINVVCHGIVGFSCVVVAPFLNSGVDVKWMSQRHLEHTSQSGLASFTGTLFDSISVLTFEIYFFIYANSS